MLLTFRGQLRSDAGHALLDTTFYQPLSLLNRHTANCTGHTEEPWRVYVSASSSSSSFARKCIFLNSRLLTDGQDEDAGGRSLGERTGSSRGPRALHVAPQRGPPDGGALPTRVTADPHGGGDGG